MFGGDPLHFITVPNGTLPMRTDPVYCYGHALSSKYSRFDMLMNQNHALWTSLLRVVHR